MGKPNKVLSVNNFAIIIAIISRNAKNEVAKPIVIMSLIGKLEELKKLSDEVFLKYAHDLDFDIDRFNKDRNSKKVEELMNGSPL